MDAARRRDPAALNAVLAEEFTSAIADLCTPATTRAEWIANVLSRLAIDSFEAEAGYMRQSLVTIASDVGSRHVFFGHRRFVHRPFIFGAFATYNPCWRYVPWWPYRVWVCGPRYAWY